MKITSVELQKQSASRRTKRFNIFLDGTFAFGADEDLIVNRRLVVGKEIEKKDLEEILFESEVGKIIERMYRLFSIRQRSEKEVRDYLRIKSYELKIKGKEEYSQLVIDELINKLKQKGLLNDREFAKAWVEARRRSKKKGNRALRAELLQKGLDRNTIVEVLAEDDDQQKLALQALEKKWKTWMNLPYLEKKKKAYEYLLRRGFEYEVVKEVVSQFFKQTIDKL